MQTCHFQPGKRVRHACAKIGNKIAVVGGWIDDVLGKRFEFYFQFHSILISLQTIVRMIWNFLTSAPVDGQMELIFREVQWTTIHAKLIRMRCTALGERMPMSQVITFTRRSTSTTWQIINGVSIRFKLCKKEALQVQLLLRQMQLDVLRHPKFSKYAFNHF